MPTAITPLANITLSSTTYIVTFSSITNTSRDLLLVINGNASGGSVRVQFNNDSATNYSFVYASGNGSAASSGSGTSETAIYVINGFSEGLLRVNIMDYSATDKHKSVVARGDAAAGYSEMWAGRWANTSAVSTVKVLAGGPLAVGTTLALYGVSA